MYPDKTAVLILGHHTDTAINIFRKAKDFGNLEVDFASKTFNEQSSSSQFVIIDENFLLNNKLSPVIILAMSGNYELEILSKILSGGILIYPEKNLEIINFADTLPQFFRKISFSSAHYISKNNSLEYQSDFGLIDLPYPSEQKEVIAGCGVLASQLGIPEDVFFESLM